MSTKPKSRGVRRWFREKIDRSSFQVPPSSSSQVATSQVASPSETPANSNATTGEIGDQNLSPTIHQWPTTAQSLSAPVIVSSEPASPEPTPPLAISNPAPIQPPTDTHVATSTIGQARITNVAWVGLQASLQALENASRVFGPLASAAGVLLDCFGAIETSARNQGDYEDLAAELATLSDSLVEYFKETAPEVVSKSVSSVAVGIERQAAEIRKKTKDGAERRLLGANSEEEDLIRHYRRIQSLFRQLQANISMSTWSIANQLLVNTQLEALNPEKQATYDSNLSASIGRRTCTEGTRIEVLANLVNWVYDQDTPTIYWMSGMAGTGKTTIAYTFSEWLEEHELLGASFFCTRTSTDCRDITRIIPTIVYQLARYSAQFQSTLCDVLSAEPDAGSKNISKQFERLLKEPLQKMKGAMLDNLVVVIDALDECDDQAGVRVILHKLFQSASQLPLKFFVTSRPEPDVYEAMSLNTQSRAAVHLHDIEKSLVQADIELYLNAELAFMSPSPSDIKQLAERSGALFIYAATLVRYIHPIKKRADPHKRLQTVLGMTFESIKEHAQIDGLYTAVLDSVLGDRETDGRQDDELEKDETEDIKTVLRTVLLAQEPIDIETIAKLADIGDPRRVEYALLPLRSVLHQSEATGLVSTLHTSFPDFMFNSGRSGSYFCDVVEHSQLLARRCFAVMEEQLRFNICDLESSFVPDEQVEDLSARIKCNISACLTYACRHWANHLNLVPKSDELVGILDGFLSVRLLFWVEVLSLQKILAVGIEGLLRVNQWLVKAGHMSTKLAKLVDDACNFITVFSSNPVSQSTPHIYISSLPFCPHSSLVYQKYWRRTRGLLELKGSLMVHRETPLIATWNIGLPVLSVAYSPDGNRVAVGCQDRTFSIRNAYDGTVLFGPLQGHTASVRSVAFSPDRRLLASGSEDMTVRVWDVYHGTLVAGPFESHTDRVNCVSFSPDSTRVVSASDDGTIRIWSAINGTLLLGPLTGDDFFISSVTFSPDGVLIASAGWDDATRLWNSHDGTQVASLPHAGAGTAWCVAFTPDGTRLVSGFIDWTLRVWNTSDGSLAAGPFTGHRQAINSVAISPDSTRVASGSSDCTIRVWNINDGTLVAGPFVGHTDDIRSVAYSSDGTRLISGSWDSIIRVWNVREDIPLPPVSPSQGVIFGISSILSTLDGRILSSSADEIVRIWDPSDGSFVTTPHKGQLFPTPTSPDRSYIPSISDERKLQIMSRADGSLAIGPFELANDSPSLLQFSEDGTAMLIGFEDGTIQVLNLKSGQTDAGPFIGHTQAVTSITQSNDCSLLISHSRIEGIMRVWNMLTPMLDFESCLSPLPTSTLGHSDLTVSDEWHLDVGWVRDGNGHLLFWLPVEIAPLWKSPYASLIITESGTLQIPKQKLFVGNQWSRCYVQD